MKKIRNLAQNFLKPGELEFCCHRRQHRQHHHRRHRQVIILVVIQNISEKCVSCHICHVIFVMDDVGYSPELLVPKTPAKKKDGWCRLTLSHRHLARFGDCCRKSISQDRQFHHSPTSGGPFRPQPDLGRPVLPFTEKHLRLQDD